MKIGLMLGGGGAKGSYQVGVLESLDKYGIFENISVISGTSIGAVNAYFFLGSDIERLKDGWYYGIDNNPINDGFNIGNKGLWSIDILKEIKEKYTSDEKFKKTNKDVFLIVTEIESPSLISFARRSTWKEHIIHLNKVDEPLEYVMSSASIPVVFGVKELENKYFVDGGLLNNNPIDVLIEKGCDLIFAVPLEKPIDYDKIKNNNITIVELTDFQLFPQKGIKHYLSSIDFDKEEANNRMEYGKYVAEEMLKECLNEEIVSFEEGAYKFNKIKEGFNVIKIPDYVNATLQNMIYVNYLKRKEKEDGSKNS